MKSTTWSVRLGHLLLSAKKKNEADFYETLKVVRAEQIVPLSAASFERGSYQRGYEHIIRFLTFMSLFSNPEITSPSTQQQDFSISIINGSNVHFVTFFFFSF